MLGDPGTVAALAATMHQACGFGKTFRKCAHPILKYNRDKPFRSPIFPFSGKNRR
jgi:hypothetical protein